MMTSSGSHRKLRRYDRRLMRFVTIHHLISLLVACLLCAACAGSSGGSEGELVGNAAGDVAVQETESEPTPAPTVVEPVATSEPTAVVVESDPTLLDIALAGRELAELTDADPAFFSTDVCAEVRELYRYSLTSATTVQAFEDLEAIAADVQLQADYLRSIAGYRGFADVEELEHAALVLDAYQARVRGSWGGDGVALRAAIERSPDDRFRFIMGDPVYLDDVAITQDDRDSLLLLQMAVDRAVLRCAAPPGGWREPVIDPELTRPDLSMIAQDFGGRWVMLDVATGETMPATLSLVSGLSRQRGGEQFIASTSIDRELVLIEPGTWTVTPVDGSGSGWSCPSFTTDGKSIISTSFTGGTARSRVLGIDGSADPIRLPSDVAPCPYSIGDGVVAFTDDSGALVASTFDGERRELLGATGCRHVLLAPPADQVLDVYADCVNPFHDGMYLLDLDTGNVVHHITGMIRGGDRSADGQWRILIVVPGDLQSPRVPELWIRSETNGAFALVSTEDLGLPRFIPEFED